MAGLFMIMKVFSSLSGMNVEIEEQRLYNQQIYNQKSGVVRLVFYRSCNQKDYHSRKR